MRLMTIKLPGLHPVLLACMNVMLLAAFSAAAEEWRMVASVAIDNPDQTGFVQSGSVYHYNSGEIPPEIAPAGDKRRSVLFADRLSFEFAGLKPNAKYQVRAEFLSDSANRQMEILAGNGVLEARLTLPDRTVLARTWEVPASAIANGGLTLAFRSLAGANAVVSSLEIWSTDPTPLLPPPSLAEQLVRMDTPLPRFSPIPAAADKQLLLNGEWRFSPVMPENPAAVSSSIASQWRPIHVPGEWVTQGFKVKTNEFAAYFREFRVPKR